MSVTRYLRCLTSKVKSLKRPRNRRRQTRPHLLPVHLEALEQRVLLTPVEVAKLLAGDAAAGDLFGQSVSVDGDTAVMGAFRDDDGGAESGSAYVFFRSGTTWSQQAKLTASDAAADEFFGLSVSVSGDTAVVGTHRHEDATGSVYVFTRSGTTWTQQAKLIGPDAEAGTSSATRWRSRVTRSWRANMETMT